MTTTQQSTDIGSCDMGIAYEFMVSVLTDVQERYYGAENAEDMRYLYGILKNDLTNGRVEMWRGDIRLGYAEKENNVVVAEVA